MKKLLFLTTATLFFLCLQAQKIIVNNGLAQKNKKLNDIQGTFTIGGKPFIIGSESNRLIVDYSAVFYPVEEDMNLGEAIRQENINIIDGMMQLEKCLYLERIIVNNGRTFAFYTKRKGKNGKVFFVEMEEDCQIDQEKAIEVMDLDLGIIDKHTNFTVRQSPDGSKILLAGMVKKTQKASDFFFRVYSSGMENLLWKSNFSAPSGEMDYFGDVERFSTAKDNNNIDENRFLINNEGRVFFLSNRTNVSETKIDFGIISFDSKGENRKEVDIEEPGNWLGSNFFRLNKKGNANLFFFYSAHDGKFDLKGDLSTVNTNSLSILEYDGYALLKLYDHEFDNKEQSQFYPTKSRNNKDHYNITEFHISGILDTPDGETVLLLEKSVSTLGNEHPFSNTDNGYICLMVMDSSFGMKYTHSFMRFSNSSNYGTGYSICSLHIVNGSLLGLFVNEQGQLHSVSFINSQTCKISNISAQYTDDNRYPIVCRSMMYNGGIFLPLMGKPLVGASMITLR
jgi:hypothetical protein